MMIRTLSLRERCRALRMYDKGYFLSIIAEDLTSSRIPEEIADIADITEEVMEEVISLLKDRRGAFL